MLRFDIFTLFPQMFDGPFDESIIKRAREKGLVEIYLHNIRDWAVDKHAVTDDTPYGGGGGMVMKAEPIFLAVEAVLGLDPVTAQQPELQPPCPIILMTPQGRPFTQAVAEELAQRDRLALICGRYEGVDERVREHLVTDEVSLGDFVVSGGELPAMIVVDAVTRLLPGALGDPTGAIDDSHATGLLEYPHYTRPATFRGWAIPDILVSGHHARIDEWRREQALLRTLARRPDLMERAALTEEEREWVEQQRATEAELDQQNAPGERGLEGAEERERRAAGEG
ncbi:MAG: tRNA (guanosine(37)-N1)-methyltransferase TrmD [Chloroflexota bacterium]|nr:tRNA (guanosine(37)-N1)-methyltransferase TrmD [Chloroflexota bacterium]